MVIVHPKLVTSALSPPAEKDSPGICSPPCQCGRVWSPGVGLTMADGASVFHPPAATQTWGGQRPSWRAPCRGPAVAAPPAPALPAPSPAPRVDPSLAPRLAPASATESEVSLETSLSTRHTLWGFLTSRKGKRSVISCLLFKNQRIHHFWCVFVNCWPSCKESCQQLHFPGGWCRMPTASHCQVPVQKEMGVML